MFRRIGSTLSSLAKNWAMTQKVYPALPLEVAGFFLVGALIVGLPLYLLLGWITALIAAIPAGLLGGTFWYRCRSRRLNHDGSRTGPPIRNRWCDSTRMTTRCPCSTRIESCW